MKREIRRIGVVTKPAQPETLETVCRLVAWLSARGIPLLGEPDIEGAQVEARTGCRIEKVAREELAAKVDLIVVLGGDGTMIATSRMIGEREVPVLGINYGRLGYLAEFNTEEMTNALEAVLAGDYKLQQRVMLDATLMRGSEVLLHNRVLNDVVISKSALARIVEIETKLDDQFVNRFRADGLIISTPTGSTAYNLSAGGPVIYPSMNAVVITPICPHTLSNRPLVVPDDSHIEIRLNGSVDEVVLTLDGQIGAPMEASDCVRVRKSNTYFNLVQPKNYNYFDVLRDKLRWGG